MRVCGRFKVVRLEGVEPSSQPWEGHIIAVIRQTQNTGRDSSVFFEFAQCVFSDSGKNFALVGLAFLSAKLPRRNRIRLFPESDSFFTCLLLRLGIVRCLFGVIHVVPGKSFTHLAQVFVFTLVPDYSKHPTIPVFAVHFETHVFPCDALGKALAGNLAVILSFFGGIDSPKAHAYLFIRFAQNGDSISVGDFNDAFSPQCDSKEDERET